VCTANQQDTLVPLCRRLADWTVSFDGTALSPLALARAEAAFRDVLGCMFAGAREQAVTAAAAAMAGWQAGQSRQLGSKAGVPSPAAALINGTAAHVLDYDDNFFPAITHASAVLVPALLALGDETDASLPALIEAYVAGLEIQARLGRLANPRHYESGWHATSTLGAIGAAAACAKLVGLNARQTAWAISLGASFAGGSKQQFGTSAKPLHAGAAAMHGVLAARLAEAGLDASETIFEGPWGFLAHHAAERLIERPADEPLAIETGGLVAKLYPSCMSSHLGIDGLLALKRQHAFAPGDIERVELEMPKYMIDNLRFTDPASPTEARFSMRYCAAVALIDGPPVLAHFTAPALARTDLRQLGRRVQMRVRAPGAAAAALPWGGDAVARLILCNGRVLETLATAPKGSDPNPLTPDEARRKFRDCGRQSLGAADLDALGALLDRPSSGIKLRDISRFFTEIRR